LAIVETKAKALWKKLATYKGNRDAIDLSKLKPRTFEKHMLVEQVTKDNIFKT
jgi:hypothetical protein